MKNINNNKMIRNIVFAIQTIVSSILVYFVFKLGILNGTKLSIFIGIIAFLLLIIGLWLFKSKLNTKSNAIAKIISLCLSIVLLLGTMVTLQGDSFLSNLANANKNTHVISIVVKKDSPYQNVEDVKNLDIGANTSVDSKNIIEAKSLIEKEFKFAPIIIDYTSYEYLNNDLMNNEIEVMLLSESQRPFLEEINPDFSNDTRVIGFVSYEEKVDLNSDKVNVTSETFTIYVSGIDTDGPVSTVARSDVNMLVTVNPITEQILLTSIPRDYHVPLATSGEYDKLTHAGIYGVEESVGTLENLFDISIDYYLRVNFTSVTEIVDALGGVDVYSHYTFNSYTGSYDFYEGFNTVNGKEALWFVRERYGLPNGDFDRVIHQQELLKAILKKATSPSVITNYANVLNSIGNSMELSMNESQLKDIIKKQLNDGTAWEIMQYQVNGYGAHSTTTYSMPGWDLYVMEPNYDTVTTAHDLIQSMEDNKVITLP